MHDLAAASRMQQHDLTCMSHSSTASADAESSCSVSDLLDRLASAALWPGSLARRALLLEMSKQWMSPLLQPTNRRLLSLAMNTATVPALGKVSSSV
jgi:hypothetical protein